MVFRIPKSLLYLTLLAFITPTAASQTWHIPHRYFTTEHGLPHEQVSVISQSSDQRLWVGTRSGMAFFDGSRFQAIAEPEEIRSHPITQMAAGSNATMWVGYGLGGAWNVSASGEAFVLIETRGTSIQRLLVRAETLFVFGAERYWTTPADGQGPVTTRAYPFPVATVSTLAREKLTGHGTGVIDAEMAPDGTIWILDGHLGPIPLDAPDGPPPLPAPVRNWTSMAIFESGAVWALHATLGLFSFTPGLSKTWVQVPGASHRYLFSSKDQLYASDDIGNLSTSLDGVRWTHVAGPSTGTPSLPIRTIHFDHEGGLWAGMTGGLIHVRSPRIRHLRAAAGRPVVNAQFFDGHLANSAQAATWGSGILDLRDFRFVEPDEHLYWSTLFVGGDGKTYGIAEGTLYVNTPSGWRRLRSMVGALRAQVAPDGTAFAWSDRGLLRQEGTDGTELLYPWHEDERDFHAFAISPTGRLVLRAGKYILDGPAVAMGPLRLDTLAVIDQFERARGRFLAVDKKGTVWIALWRRGLLRIRGGRSELLLAGEDVTVVSAMDTLVLASTTNGLFGLDPDLGTTTFYMGQRQGLLANLVNGAIVIGDTLYAAHVYGISKVPLSIISKTGPAPSVIIDASKPGGQDGPRTFRFFATSFAHPSDIRYEYRLRTGDAWQEARETVMTFELLPPGTYVFEVRASAGEQDFGIPARHAFVVPAPFYRKPWFVLLVIFVFLSASASTHYYRMRRAAARERELVGLVQERTRKLADATSRAEDQARRLEQIDQTKTRLLANISHEMRTPLTLIRVPLQHLLTEGSGQLTDEQINEIGTALDHSGRLARLVEQLIALARLKEGSFQPVNGPVDLVQLVRKITHSFLPEAAHSKVALAFESSVESAGAIVDADVIETIVYNLVSNALKFTNEGGNIHVALDLDGSMFTLTVSDSGVGIPPEELPRIFDRFFQGATGALQAGAGIGLALVKELVEHHGGSVDVKSTEGEGTRFTVRFQVERTGFTVATPSADQASGPASFAEGKRGAEAPLVLIVDDHPDLRDLLVRRIGTRFRVIAAADGNEALEIIRSSRPDLVVSDVMMPGMDGLSLLGLIRSNPDTRDVPILLLTAKAGAEDTVEGFNAGADDYVAKPFEVDELIARIQRLIETRRTLREQYTRRVLVGAAEIEVSSADEALLLRTMEAIEEFLALTHFSAEMLALAVGLSARQFRRRLRQITGEAPADLIRRVRLERAASLISTGHGGVAEIAYKVGYNDPQVFSRHFKKHFGCVPSRYPERVDSALGGAG
jgi:signal transduction histidine kinase/DNA-binding response OmpR family regulator